MNTKQLGYGAGGVLLAIAIVERVEPASFGPENDQYSLGYMYASDPQELGFVFGANKRIGYWQPSLCDDGGCDPYPEAFKQKFPATFQAYQERQAASQTSDKDKMNLVCAP